MADDLENLSRQGFCLVKPSVLLVVDSPGYRGQLKWMILEEGYVVTEVGNEQEAVDVSRHEQFDLIIVSVESSVFNGYDVTKKIRELDQYAHTPILALSILDSAVVKAEAYQAGFDLFFNKLTDMELLRLTLQEFLKSQ